MSDAHGIAVLKKGDAACTGNVDQANLLNTQFQSLFSIRSPPCLAKLCHSKLLNAGVVTVQDSKSGKSFSSILDLAKNVQKSPIKCLKEQDIHRKQSVYAYVSYRRVQALPNKLISSRTLRSLFDSW